MTADRRSHAVVAIAAVALLTVAVGALVLAPTVTADPHDADSTAYVIEQDDHCVPVGPVARPDQSVEEFYDYRVESNPSTYSSYGTTEYQKDNTSTLMLYEGSEGTSLVFVHEKLHVPAEEGSLGSAASFNVTGISPGESWAVEDDDYDGQDDLFHHNDTYSTMHWTWGQGRTDGGAYRGLGENTEIGIEPAFNDEALFDYGGQYAGYVHNWSVVSATDDGFERIALDNLYQDVTVRAGHCAAPSASLTVDEPAPGVGATVSLDASESTAAATATYQWDLTGDGDVDRTTDAAEIEHAFSDPGERTVSVTIVDQHGRNDTASVAVDVQGDAPPTARVDAPGNATVGESIEVSGADSSDDNEIERYEWDFGDGTVIGDGEESADPTVTHTYDEPGTYEIELTVTDPAGNENATTANVVVEDADPPEPSQPVANLTAPETATTGEPVPLDASDSTVGEDASYEWLVDNETVDATESPTNEVVFDEPGDRTVTVVVSDDGGTDSAETTVQVAEPLDAVVAANRTSADAGERIRFNATSSTGPIERYEWAFGDGTTIGGDDAGPTVSHAYEEPGSYTAELTVVGETGENATDEIEVEIENLSAPTGPTAALDPPDPVHPNETVTLDARDSTAGENATYAWFVGDELVGPANGTDAPTYDVTFSEPGNHTVRVRVDDENGSATDEEVVEVVAPPTASATANRTTVHAGDPIRFDARDSPGDVAGYEWELGDGTVIGNASTTATRTVTHAYDEPGNYTVRLTVYGPLGTSNETTMAINVTAAPEPPAPSEPVAKITAPETATVDEAVTLDANASTVSGNVTYEWLVGDETETTTESPTHDVVFDEPGETTVGVIVRDDGGNDTATATVVVENASDGDGETGDGDDGDGDNGDSGDGDGGGGAPPRPPDPDPLEPDPPEEPIEPTVAVENGTVLVTAEDVDAGDAFAVDVPANANDDARRVDLRSIEVTAGADAEELAIDFEPAARSVPGRFASEPAYEPDASTAIESVRYEFAVDRRILSAAGVSSANVTVYARDGEWAALDTEIDDGGDANGDVENGERNARVVASATVQGDAPVGVGAVGPALFVRDVETDGPMTNGTVDVVAHVQNTGIEGGEWTLPVETVDGRADERTVALDAGERTTIRATVSIGGSDDAAVSVGGVRRPVAAVAVSDLRIGSVEPAPNESVAIDAVLVNHGTATAAFDATLLVGDDAVASNDVHIAPGERTTVTFERRLGAAGTYDLAVGNATTTVRVSERDSFDETDDGGDDSLGGFGVLVALVAVSLAMLCRRRIDS